MRESDFIDRVAETTGQSKTDVKRTLRAITSEIIECVAHGDSISFRHFGSFHPKYLSKTTRFIPSCGQAVDLPARRVPRFRYSSAFRERCKEIAERLNHL